jgi:metallophosphoesterase (TIGR00282 family)
VSLVTVIMLGDVVGDPGLEALETQLPALIRENAACFVTVNGENAAEGFGMTGHTLQRIFAAGADAVTSGTHVWEKRDFWPALDTENRLLRPANYPSGTPGRGWIRLEKAGVSWLVVNLQGRDFMTPIDCPFRCFDSILNSQEIPPFITLVDFHAESTREKEALAYYLDGRAGILAGTHTHVQTADERILPGGTAYITDLGMTGIRDSVIGMDQKICLDRARYQVLYRMECAKPGPGSKAAVQGIIAHIDSGSGKAVSIKRIPDCQD